MKIEKLLEKDCDEVLNLISKLCEYVKYCGFKKDLAKFKSDIFKKKLANVLVCKKDEEIVGYAIFYKTYCSFELSGGIFLDNIFIKEAYRKEGIAKMFFDELKLIAKEENFSFIEWICKKSNIKALEFYAHIGADLQNKHERFRLRVD